MPALRVGQGFDVHRFSEDPGRKLVLGGLTVPSARGLEGHSDADVVTHALADALLGAAQLADLGSLFPESDPTLRGASSLTLLESVVAMIEERGARTLNADCTVVCDTPRLGHLANEMSRRLAEVVGAPVGVKIKRAEGLGALGRGEGIACICTALLESVGEPGEQGPRT